MGKGDSSRRIPLSLGGPELIVAIDDDAFDDLAPRVGGALAEPGTAPLRIVRASELTDPNTEADLYYGRYRPSTPGCEKILDYVSAGHFDQFEQDHATGAVYRSGKLVWPSAPLAVANMNGGPVLEAGADAALYFASGLQIRITTIPDVFVVARQFTTRAAEVGESIMPTWIEQARAALADSSKPHRPS